MSVYRPNFTDKKTGEVKQSAVWWYSFTFAGRRYQESSKSTRKTVARAAEERRRLELEQAYAGIVAEKPEQRIRTVSAALKEYRDAYANNHRAKSVTWVKERCVHVERILGRALMPDLSEARINEYIAQRLKEKAGNRTINMELECLARAIGRQWRILWPKLRRLEESKGAGQALSTEQEQKLLDAAAKNRSEMVRQFIRIALLTGMRVNEIRTLKWEQVDLENQTLKVGKAKTSAGSGRVIPMNPQLFATLAEYAGWLARKLDRTIEPGWYVFPFTNRGLPIDPLRPVTTIKTAWEAVRTAAGVSCRFHDLRHTALTKMAEAGVPEETMKALMGHMSREMIERYSHIRMNAKRTAVESLSLPNKIAPSKESTKVTESAVIQ